MEEEAACGLPVVTCCLLRVELFSAEAGILYEKTINKALNSSLPTFLKSSILSNTTASLFRNNKAFFGCAAHVFGGAVASTKNHEKLGLRLSV